MHSASFRITFLRLRKFLQIKERRVGGEEVRDDLISWRNQSCRRTKLSAPPFCHSCQISRINHEAHGFGKFFWISHEFDKSQGFSWNSRFFLKEISKLYLYAILHIPQLLSVLSIFFSLRLDAARQCLTLSDSFVVSNLIYPRTAKYFSGCSQLSSLSENSIEKFSLK